MITRLIWTIWTPMSSVPEKADKLNLSLSDMLLESDVNFGEVINGSAIHPDSAHLSLYDMPPWAGFCTGNWSSLSLPIQTCIMLWVCYASAFRRRRHYVFGLSVRPSVRSLKYPLLTCTWVRWSTRPTVAVLWHVRPSVRPSGEVSGHLPENALRDWPGILHADVSWPSSELISLWPWSVDFSKFGTILT